jgi:hypothetical protein|tara:strand:- start:2986 stop:3288 length:303 start_codon:yes stop_codon:yes gene_type:complete
MKNTIFIIFSLLFLGCNSNDQWTVKEKNNYMVACITNYDKVKSNSLQEARCYCIEALNLTINLYPIATDADSKMTIAEVKLISNKAAQNLKGINDIGTCL